MLMATSVLIETCAGFEIHLHQPMGICMAMVDDTDERSYSLPELRERLARLADRMQKKARERYEPAQVWVYYKERIATRR